MAQKLTENIVKNLPPPATGNKVHYDALVRGFGLRVTANGSKSFVLGYRTRAGRERRLTLGAYPDWSVTAAREEAKNLKRRIDLGEDPMADIEAVRDAPTVADLVERFKAEHLPRLRPASRKEYERMLNDYILPALRNHKVADVSFSDIDRLHRAITKRGATYVANRVVSLASKMFSLSVKWGYRTDSPTKGIEMNPEHARHRFLSGDEFHRLSLALAAHPDKTAVAIIRLLMLSGSRRTEILSLRWSEIDFERGIWTKAPDAVKQGREFRLPLSAPVLELLAELREAASPDTDFVFPGRLGGHRNAPYVAWKQVCEAADISGVRLHDLRHSFASVLVSSGLSLEVIGDLLGHSRPQTTARYAHLHDHIRRQATDTAAAIITGQPSAEVVKLRGA